MNVHHRTDFLDLTIIVPTRNRPAFLRRLFAFFAEMKVTAAIHVIDSSDTPHGIQNSQTIAAYSQTLRLKHVLDSGGMVPKCRRAMEAVQTHYCVFCADDDFLLSDAMLACIDFLDQHPDYQSAMGSWAYLDHAAGDRCHQTRCFPLDDHDPLRRCERLAKHWFSNFYAVYRTDPLCRAWVLTDEATDYDRARVFPETLLAQTCALNCKLAILPCLHSLLSLHDENEHRKTPLVTNQDSVTELYDRFKAAFVSEIVRCSTTSPLRAEAFVDQSYGFLRHQLADQQGRPRGWARFKKNLKNQIYTNRDRLFSSPVNIWLRRRLRHNHPLCQSPSWQAAYRLATEFPQGIETTDYSISSAAA